MALQSRVGVLIKTALLLCVVSAFVLGFIINFESIQSYLSYARGMDTAHILLGRTLATIPWSSEPVIAIGDAGAVPYYSGLETVDTFGLNNPIIARNFRRDRSDYVLSKNPSVVILISKNEDRFDSPLLYENVLFQACIKHGFSRHVTFIFNENYYLWVIWRPDLQDAHILEEALNSASQQSHQIIR